MKTLQLLTTFLLLLLTISIQAQEVPRRVVAEHFTNSRCGICSSRNPGFYQNLNSQEDVLHVSFHPSSPYSNCVLHQVNPAENDARTQYYGIYGGTPRFVIQGEVVPLMSSYASPSIFEDHINQTTPIELTLQQQKSEGVIQLQVNIKAATDNTLGQQSLFLGIAEDTVFYDAPNGEDEHYDVFRQTFTAETEGILVDIPATAGETLTLSYSATPEAAWNFDRLYVVAILQNTMDQSVIQSNATTTDQDNLTATREPLTLATKVFPNPVQDRVQIQLETTATAQYFLTNLQGQILRNQAFIQQTTLDLANLPTGVYQLEVLSAGERSVQKLVKE